VNELDWLAVGEGLIGVALGILVGVVWTLARVVTGGARNGRYVSERGSPDPGTTYVGPGGR
jgi:hypothetical protein